MLFTHMNVHDLFYKNKLYAEKDMNAFSSTRMHDQMFLYSEICDAVYPGYKVDEGNHIRADKAKTVNLKKLKEVLLSKDEKLL